MASLLERVGPPLTEPWYAARRRTVTASNSAHLMLGPDVLRWWLDPDALAARILGDEPVPRNERMEACSFFESANLGWFGYVVGRAPEPDGYLTLDSSRPHVGASLDGRLGPKTDAPTLPFDPSLVVRDAWGRCYYGRDGVRALADLPTLLFFAERHLAPGGTALFPKGATWKKELEDARRQWSFEAEAITSKTEPTAAILKINGVTRV